MAKKFNQLLNNTSSERKKRIEDKTQEMLIELALQDIRQQLNLTQEQVAEMLQTSQAAVSKLENQSDIYVSTLSRFVSALGGNLKLVASFPNREILINQFD
jgi:transcriptional regulator with XRE-family HTH domain